MQKQNCWESLNCGKQSECPAYPDHGRECFAVANTLCRGEEQGSYMDKIRDCRSECGYYKLVMAGIA